MQEFLNQSQSEVSMSQAPEEMPKSEDYDEDEVLTSFMAESILKSSFQTFSQNKSSMLEN